MSSTDRKVAHTGVRLGAAAFDRIVARGALLAAAAVYGGWLYHLQRAHVVQHFAQNRLRDASFPTMR